MIKIVSCYIQRHRTNDTESWHRKINNIIKRKSNLLLFFSELKDEAQKVNFNVLQNEIRPDVYRRRHQKYINKDNKIEIILRNYLDGTNDLKKRLLSCRTSNITEKIYNCNTNCK
jgi:hypothetical protein